MKIVATGAILLVSWWLLLLIHAVFKRYFGEYLNVVRPAGRGRSEGYNPPPVPHVKPPPAPPLPPKHKLM